MASQMKVPGQNPVHYSHGCTGDGINILGITNVIHLKTPHDIIDYAQEETRAERAGECVTVVILIGSDGDAYGYLYTKFEENFTKINLTVTFYSMY